ncbi:MAG TPA: adenine deaminase [Williamwhitmania sp.]|nr:adenine deaminase [Williamwhitmania sp.]
MKKSIVGNIVDVAGGKIGYGEVVFDTDGIESILILGNERAGVGYVLPGFVDAHVHIESSMVSPFFFGAMAVKHGTVAVVSDPHEIANVIGEDGINFMIENAKASPLKFFFGVPSCVPATFFETSGAELDSEVVGRLLKRDDIYFLAEMMNYPGVISGDERVLAKLRYARALNKPVDGHIPGVGGADLERYVAAGISTDHECFTVEEAREKIALGMKILIREGSAAKNFTALHPLILEHPDMLMFCTDDCHPNDFQYGHINLTVKRALALGYDLFTVLKIACINPVLHYKLPVGLLAVGDSADFIVVDNPKNFNITQTYINGACVWDAALPLKSAVSSSISLPNKFNRGPIATSDIAVVAKSVKVRTIQIMDGELVTKEVLGSPIVENNYLISNPTDDVLKIVVVNRYQNSPPAVGFIRGMGISRGAIATTIAHDSHNIICVGVKDEDIVNAVNTIVDYKGGLCVYNDNEASILPLPIAGLMSNLSVVDTADKYDNLEGIVRKLGSTLSSPFMTLSFMALIVIPEIKLSDRGLFSTKNFSFINLYA